MAINIENYFPEYQPIVNMTSGQVSGYEALARRKDNQGHSVSVAELFFDDKVSTSSKLAIDRHVRHLALKKTLHLVNEEFLTINISPSWIENLDSTIVIPTLEMVDSLGVNPSRIIIEITETYGDTSKLKRLVNAYHDAGYRVAIDDFGEGASQIDRLIALEPDIIKVDMHLFKRASLGGIASAVVQSINTIAQRKGCEMIFEGIETEDELNFALDCGANYVQGWLFQKSQSDFILTSKFVEQTKVLKNNFLRKKSSRHIQIAEHMSAVMKQVVNICNTVQKSNQIKSALEKFDLNLLHQLGIQRVFLCDQEGNQISPNYEINTHQIDVHDSCMGANWSHRPYFPLLTAMNSFQLRHMIVSEPYRDVMSGRLCKTLASFLSTNKVLLVDVNTSDHVLHVSDDTE
jgi:EAL domain-containing protein (putative c-di-GMP-specific phosphodiesterase class I)